MFIVSYSKCLRNFFARLNIFGGKECNLRESYILMIIINTNWYRIRFAWVIEEPAHITIEIGINAKLYGKETSFLRKCVQCLRLDKIDIYAWWAQIKEICVVGTTISFAVRQYFARILADECTAWDLCNSSNAEAFDTFVAFEYLHSHFRSFLYDSIFAQQFIAAAYIITFKDHRRIMVLEIADQSTIRTVPILNGDLTALAILCGATISIWNQIWNHK